MDATLNGLVVKRRSANVDCRLDQGSELVPEKPGEASGKEILCEH